MSTHENLRLYCFFNASPFGLREPTDRAAELQRVSAKRYLFSAKGAAIIPSLGRRPRNSYGTKIAALKARFDICEIEHNTCLNRAFSAAYDSIRVSPRRASMNRRRWR